ncbi:MAG: leucine-rich repeat domain-containing protein, partial [Paraprevotella sp.]|nr:leucine-rich repeat domain-containing protein [Paraprevotella sp.]
AFEGCTGLTSITIPNSVTSIGVNVIDGCSNLKKIELNCDTIYNCFNNSSIEEIIISNSVTSIEDYAFSGCTSLTSVTIPNSVTSIGNYAFKGCTGLTSITIPNSVTSIGYQAFEGCTGLTSITIPNSVTSIGYKAFYNCTSLTNITIPNSVTSIGNYAFYGCNNLTSLAIPNGVTSIGDYAFYGCKNLTSLAIPNGVKSINSNTFSNCLSLKFVIIPKSVNYINSTAFYNSNTGVVINFSALSISKGSSSNGYVAFYAKKVVNVSNGSIEDDFVFDVVNGEKNILVAYLGEGGALTLPANYKGEAYVIGGNAFSGNTSITSIQIPSSITSIGVEAFDGCSSLTSITIPNSVTSIGYKAFNECTNLTNIMIPNSVTSIGDYAFYDCVNLKTVINFSGLSISKSSSNNGYVAYYADNVINASNGSIEDDFVFSVVGEKNILTGYLGEGGALTLPADYRGEDYVIGENAFSENTSITSVEIPSSVTSIGDSAFEGCSGLTSIKIPSSVTSIGNSAFYNCVNLKTVINGSGLTFEEGATTYGYIAYYADKVINGTIDGDFIFNKTNGKYYMTGYLGNDTHVVLPDKYNGQGYVIGTDAFNNCNNILSITIGSNVEEIEFNAFYGCENIAKVFWLPNTPPEGYSNIYGYLNGKINYVANNNYKYLNNIVVTQFLSSKFEVDGMVFIPLNLSERTCCVVDDLNNNLSNITIKETVSYKNVALSVTDIMPYAFYKNDVLTSLTLENKGSVGISAFEGCTSLNRIDIPESTTSVGDYAFKDCDRLKVAKIEDRTTVLPLGKKIFDNSPLNSLYIGAKISYINDMGSEASPFCGNKYLKSVVITDVESDIFDYEFYSCIGLESVTVGDGVERIGKWAFSGCSNLSEFVFGSNVTSIGEEAFSDCVNMTTITGRAVLPPVCGAQALDDINKWNCTLLVPELNLKSYQNADQWKEFLFVENFVTQDNYVTYIIDGEIYKTLLLTPGNSIIAPYVADKNGKPFGGWNMNDYISISGYPIMPDEDITIYGSYNTSAVESIKADKKENVIYDLYGRVVDVPTKGIYIINGKKVLVK